MLWCNRKDTISTSVRRMLSVDSERKKRMISIIKELKVKVNELEKIRAREEKKSRPKERAETLIEEIHVPALDALRENRKTVH